MSRRRDTNGDVKAVVYLGGADFLPTKSPHRDKIPREAKMPASNQFFFCIASNKARPKNNTKIVRFVNFIFAILVSVKIDIIIVNLVYYCVNM